MIDLETHLIRNLTDFNRQSSTTKTFDNNYTCMHRLVDRHAHVQYQYIPTYKDTRTDTQYTNYYIHSYNTG